MTGTNHRLEPTLTASFRNRIGPLPSPPASQAWSAARSTGSRSGAQTVPQAARPPGGLALRQLPGPSCSRSSSSLVLGTEGSSGGMQPRLLDNPPLALCSLGQPLEILRGDRRASTKAQPERLCP